MSNLCLSPVEIAILKGAVRRGDPDKVYSELLQTLDSLCDPKTGKMFISQNTLELIQHYGLEGRTPTWRATLLAIFRRTLGDQLGRFRDESGKLLEREKARETS